MTGRLELSGRELEGRIMRTITVTEREAYDYDCCNPGACLACGAKVSGVEPDAANYECPECGAMEVFGYEELAIMGGLVIA